MFIAVPAIAIFLCGLAAATQPAEASAFASTTAVSKCNLFAPQGGSDDEPVSALAPTVTYAGTCGTASGPLLFESSVSASAGLAAGGLTISASGAFTLGELHVSVDGSGPVQANAFARIQDLLTIIPTPGFADAGFSVTLTLVSTGSLSGNAFAGGGLSAVSAIASSNFPTPALCTAAAPICADGGVPQVPAGAQTQTITVTIPVLTGAPFLSLTALLFANDNEIGNFANFLDDQDGSADFADTAVFSITLPTGFSFTSDSGAVGLLTGPVSEPVTLAILGLGLAGIGFMRRYGRS